MWRSMLPFVVDGSFSLSLASLCGAADPASEEFVCTSVPFAEWLSNLLVCIHKLTMTLAFIDSRVCGKGEGAFKDGAVKCELDAAFNLVEQLLQQIGVDVENPPDRLKNNKILTGLQFDLTGMSSWLANCGKALRAAGCNLAKFAIAFTKNAAAETQRLTPTYSHCLTGKKLQPNLIKKTLLAGSARSQLSEKAIVLHRLVSTSSGLRSRWLPADDCNDCEIELAEGIFTEAKNACTVIAAAAILFEHAGPNQQAERDKFFAGGKDRKECGDLLLAALKAL